MSGFRKSLGVLSNTRTPSAEKKNAATAAGRIDSHGMRTRRAYCAAATPVPHSEESLFVPNTSGEFFRKESEQRRQLNQPTAAHDGINESGDESEEAEPRKFHRQPLMVFSQEAGAIRA